MRGILIGALTGAVVVGMFSLGVIVGQGSVEPGKPCTCKPCQCPYQRGDGRRTGEPTGDVAPDSEGR